MNCLIYLRVSTKEQAEEGYSIPAQKEACLKYIQDKDWNFIDCYIDRGESARSAHRPQLQEMLSRVKKGKTINAVVVHKIDRLARNLEDHVAIKAILKRSEVALVSVVENIEDSASGRLIEGIHALMAEFYSANLATEIKKGMNQKVKEGGWPKMAPVGYKNIRDERGVAHIIPDPEMSPLVKEAFELYATGEYPLRVLHEHLTGGGFLSNMTKKPMVRSKVAEMLQNKVYIGIVTWNGVEYKGKHEPLVSKALFARVQEVFAIRNTAGERIRKHPHYLRGTLYCGYCGARLSSSLSKGQYLYFWCLGRRRDIKSCPQSHIPADVIETAINNLYQKIQLPQAVVEELTLKLERELVNRESHNFKQREFVAKKMVKLNHEREKLLQAFYAEAIPVDLLKKEQDRISTEVAMLETKQQTVSSQLDQIDQIIKVAIKMASNCYLAYQKASDKNKRMLNQAFFKKIYFKNKKMSGYDYSELFECLYNSKSSSKEPLVELRGFEPLTSALRTQRSPN